MATSKNTIPARSNRARSNKPLSAEDKDFQLRMANIMTELLAANSSPTMVLTRSQRLRLADVSENTGISVEFMMRRAVKNWLAIEAPVYLDHYVS